MRSILAWGLMWFCLGAVFATSWVQLTRATPAEARAQQFAAIDTSAYTLTGSTLTRAKALGRVERRLAIADTVWTPAMLLLLLGTGVAAWMRDLVARSARGIWLQGYGFALLTVIVLRVAGLPLAIWAYWTALKYGLSVQRWTSWSGDWAKGVALEWAIGGLILVILMWVLRRTGTRWWVWFWGVAAGLVVAGVFVSPYVIDPLFNRFTPMQQSDPALVAQLERVVARSGMSIAPERMFVMQASAKSTQLNAYVTGFGTSKRVVVWDTTIARSSPDEIAFIFAHELGIMR